MQCKSLENKDIRIPEECTIQCAKTIKDHTKRLVISKFDNDIHFNMFTIYMYVYKEKLPFFDKIFSDHIHFQQNDTYLKKILISKLSNWPNFQWTKVSLAKIILNKMSI